MLFRLKVPLFGLLLQATAGDQGADLKFDNKYFSYDYYTPRLLLYFTND